MLSVSAYLGINKVTDRIILSDSSSIHPDLVKAFGTGLAGKAYYKSYYRLKLNVQQKLNNIYCPEHDLFMFTNTTDCLVNFLFACQLNKLGVKIDTGDEQHYPQYRHLFQLFSEVSVSGDCPDIQLVTHLSPVTGHLLDLSPLSGHSMLAVDGAQSFATVHHSDLIKHSDVFFAPLHKHAGLHIGIAVLGIKRSHPLNQVLSSTLETVSSGARSLQDLMALEKRLSSAQPQCFNSAFIHISPRIQALLNQNGVTVISSDNSHMVVVECRSAVLRQKLASFFSCKPIKNTDRLRISVNHMTDNRHYNVDFSESFYQSLRLLFDEDNHDK
ncbi:DUF6024 family protein [Photobacterium halotolerans]|uniref:DUF6024 family protein n=1 Tax=Photobacterium halotolerans TaxID=265726 RepID=UPI000426DED1|nr:DUF6024 family protein [Photobacterium halotolerans]